MTTNTGHGHVVPRPDGVKARCGGPGLCAVCSDEERRQRFASTALETSEDEALPYVPSAPLVAVGDNAEPMDAERWAELYRLREAVKGPDGFATWQEAAEHERNVRVNLQRDLDSTILGNAAQKPFGYIDLDAIDNPRLEKRWNTREFMSQTTPFYLAGQVAPQATVEPLTDEFIKDTLRDIAQGALNEGWSRALNDRAFPDEKEFIENLVEASAKLIATPPTNKATAPASLVGELESALCNMECEGSGFIDAAHLRGIMYRYNQTFDVATSKADTGEAIREAVNAGLEMAASVVEQGQETNTETAHESLRHVTKRSKGNMMGLAFADAIRALKSATPSTIKAEPTKISALEEALKKIHAGHYCTNMTDCLSDIQMADIAGAALDQFKAEPTGEQL